MKIDSTRDMAATATPANCDQPRTPVKQVGPFWWGRGEFGRVAAFGLSLGRDHYVVLSARLYHS